MRGGDRDFRRRLRPRVTLAALVGIIVAATVTGWNPLNLAYAGWLLLFLLLAAIALLTVALMTTFSATKPLRIFAATSGVALFATTAAIGGITLATFGYGSDWKAITRVAAPDGRYELMTIQGAPFAIDPIYAVRLRTDRGPLTQDVLVWQGREEGAMPTGLRFAGPREIEVITDDGCRFRSTFNGFTLNLSETHEQPSTQCTDQPR